MNIRDVAKVVDRQLMNAQTECSTCGAVFHVAWDGCLCPEPETVECVRCGRKGAPHDETLVDVKDVGIVGAECLYDDDTVEV